MEHLTKKPFYLTDEDILWVGNTLADMTEDEMLARLMYAPGHGIPFSPIGRMGANRVKALQNKGFAANVIDFPGNEVDAREYHMIEPINTLSCKKWDTTFGAGYRACIDEGVMAVMVAPIVFPAYTMSLNPLIADGDCLPATICYELTTLLLKKTLGFNGLVIAENIESEEMSLAIAAGCDMLFSSGNIHYDIGHIKKGIDKGIITQDRLREAAVQILGIEAALGLHK
jgi:beta-N-acetylhexosaminidase